MSKKVVLLWTRRWHLYWPKSVTYIGQTWYFNEPENGTYIDQKTDQGPLDAFIIQLYSPKHYSN